MRPHRDRCWTQRSKMRTEIKDQIRVHLLSSGSESSSHIFHRTCTENVTADVSAPASAPSISGGNANDIHRQD